MKKVILMRRDKFQLGRNKTVITERYEYDADGKLSCISFFSNMSGDLQSKQIYKDGLLTEEQKYAADYPESKLSSTKYYAYDKKGLHF